MTAVNLNRAVRGPVTAVPVVAGHGVRIVPDTVNNRFVAEADETVLYEKSIAQGATLSSPTIALSETLNNFDRVRVYWRTWASAYSSLVSEFDTKTGNAYFTCIGGYWNGTNASTFIINLTPNSGLTELSFSAGKFVYLGTAATPSNANGTVVYKVVGINRIASN